MNNHHRLIGQNLIKYLQQRQPEPKHAYIYPLKQPNILPVHANAINFLTYLETRRFSQLNSRAALCLQPVGH